jgi:hypothetical protein
LPNINIAGHRLPGATARGPRRAADCRRHLICTVGHATVRWPHEQEHGIVSIESIASNVWTRPYQPQSGVGGSSNVDPPPSSSTAGSNSTTSGTGAPVVASANPFQQLASDIQALLVQAQGGATSTDTAASTTGAATSVSPEQQVGTDLQTLLAQLQSGQPGSDPNAPTATTGQTGATGQAQPHHHHHGGGPGAGMDAASQAGATTPSSATTAATSTSSGTALSSSDQTASRAFAADILQALQAYGSNTSSTTVPGLTA